MIATLDSTQTPQRCDTAAVLVEIFSANILSFSIFEKYVLFPSFLAEFFCSPQTFIHQFSNFSSLVWSVWAPPPPLAYVFCFGLCVWWGACSDTPLHQATLPAFLRLLLPLMAPLRDLITCCRRLRMRMRDNGSKVCPFALPPLWHTLSLSRFQFRLQLWGFPAACCCCCCVSSCGFVCFYVFFPSKRWEFLLSFTVRFWCWGQIFAMIFEVFFACLFHCWYE